MLETREATKAISEFVVSNVGGTVRFDVRKHTVITAQTSTWLGANIKRSILQELKDVSRWI